MGALAPVSSRITPGPMHNILRAETFALYQVLRLANKADVSIDNSHSTAVFYANELPTHGFHLSSWEVRADGYLWSLIASEIVSRPKSSIRLLKIKAHTSLEDAVDSFRERLAAGNAAADRFTKSALASFVAENKVENQASIETTRMKDASLVQSSYTRYRCTSATPSKNRPKKKTTGVSWMPVLPRILLWRRLSHGFLTPLPDSTLQLGMRNGFS